MQCVIRQKMAVRMLPGRFSASALKSRSISHALRHSRQSVDSPESRTTAFKFMQAQACAPPAKAVADDCVTAPSRRFDPRSALRLFLLLRQLLFLRRLLRGFLLLFFGVVGFHKGSGRLQALPCSLHIPAKATEYQAPIEGAWRLGAAASSPLVGWNALVLSCRGR